MKKAWTYSHLDSFESCPLKFYKTKVTREIIEERGPHAEWGERVHTALEEFVLEDKPLPDGMQHWESIATKIKSLPGEKLCEYKMALDRNFQPTDWKAAWTRGIADLVITYGESAVVMDYKTGKRKPSEQLDLYANYVFAHFPRIQKVTTVFVWLKEKKLDKKQVQRDEQAHLWQSILPRVAKLESAYKRDSWPARPSGLCNGWCPVTTCKFYRPRKT